jgi:hypothetical protein
MSFPAVALDMEHPLRDSWNRTRGHWWKVLGVMILGFLPLIIGFVKFFVFASNQIARIFYAAVYSSVTPVVGAALASELYRNFGGLIEHNGRMGSETA